MSTGPNRQQTNPLPLAIIFEGRSQKLTTLLHTTIAIWLVVLVNDRDGFFYAPFRYDHWTSKFVFYLAAMFAAICQAALAMGVLSLNLRPVTQENWRRRICQSGFALFLIDMMALDYMGYAVDSITKRHEKVSSVPATAFVSFVGTALAISFNIIYIKMFGCCTCCCCRCCCCGTKTRERVLASAEHSEWTGYKSSVAYNRSHGFRQQEASSSASTEFRSRLKEYGAENIGAEAENGTHGLQIELGNSNVRAPVASDPSTGRRDETEEEDRPPLPLTAPSVDTIQRDLYQTSNPFKLDRRWNTMQLVELGTNRLANRRLQIPESSQHDTIVEEETQETSETLPRQTSARLDGPDAANKSPRKNAPGKITTLRRYLASLWDGLREEPGRFRYAVWIKAAFLTSVIVLIYKCIRTISIVYRLADRYAENRERFTSNIDAFDLFLKSSGWSNGIESIEETTVVKVYLVLDALLVDMKTSALVGYCLGTAVGLWSLAAVLMQYKHMSLCISEGLRAFRREDSAQRHGISPWASFQKKYPIMGACVFMAILSSTAVIQLHIVGVLFSILVGLIINYSKIVVLLELFGLYVLALILVIVIDIVIKQFLTKWLISPDGARIKRPRWFNFFVLVLSMVNLVVGFLLALYRLVYLLITTLVILNRLDICLFTAGKALDNGHNAFMSMLVLTVLVQEDREACAAQSHRRCSAQPSNI